MQHNDRLQSAYLRAVAVDNSLPIEPEALELWLKDLANPFRWIVRPLLQFIFAILLHLTWFFKRLPLPQFSHHVFLQKMICVFCKYFVSYEANLLILRHYATESNILNFMVANSGVANFNPVKLYPCTLDEMMGASFVKHDEELFRLFAEMGPWQHRSSPALPSEWQWTNWKPVVMADFNVKKRWTQVVDFESAHALFMCLFCLLLTREQYRDAINGFNLDQSLAIRIGQIFGNPQLVEMAYNKYPQYLVGPWNLGQRFLMHGFFTEYLYAYLEAQRSRNIASDEN